MITPFRVGWLVLSLWLFMLLGYGVARPQFTLLMTLSALLFWGYSRIAQPLWFDTPATHDATVKPDRFLFGAAILFRLALLVMTPNLSDDYARFLWDGHLVANGYNPYEYLPSQFLGTSMAASAGLTDALFQRLNSPDYFSVYPPLTQVLFGVAAGLFPGDGLGAIVALRVPILLAEFGTLWLLVRLLRRFGMNPNRALLYGLNPLVILELTGNLHFEAVMIFFVLLAVWLFTQQRRIAASVVLALGIATKLLPLLLFPLLIRRLGWKRGLAYASLIGGLIALLFTPFLSVNLLHNIMDSLNLYFQKFEFNASVYYLIRTVGYWLKGYNIIGQFSTTLRLLIILSVVYIAVRTPNRSSAVTLAISVLLTLTIYWLLSTTVHPWYISSLLIPALFTRFRYPFVWSALIVVSYATYQTQPYQEHLWLTALEYAVVVGYGMLEWKRVIVNQPVRA
ncbi:DUF2029 domain-containing protein [Spirosoma rhododendri]|uniref:DUF2029 domain-containing protein n=1 Tax=Spirosoma rhododendri TaxID=2728024 RepID=A0A7L5DS23_9BACT|nr:DUF2029 domain-containing protein [Spirosoma rhododendri]